MAKSSKFLSQPAYDYLLDLIFTKKLLPGDKIPEKIVAEKFNMSRTPVRDAMRQLANEGLITIYPNRFAQVSEFTPEVIMQIGTLRLSMDTLAIKLAMLFGSQADFLELKKIALECDEAYQEKNNPDRIKLDSDFHMKLAEISKNTLLIKFQTEINLRVRFAILHYPNSIKNEEKHISQHVEIADAMLEHNEDKALGLIIEHLSSFYNLGNNYPESFFGFMKNT